MIEYTVGYARMLAGGAAFDEAAARDLVRRDVERARSHASVQNHDVLPHGDGPDKPLSRSQLPRW